MSALNIVFAGTPEFGLPCLQALKASPHSVKAIYTQPDRPAGRGRKLQASAVKEWALVHDVPVYQPLNFKSQESVAELAQLNPDVIIVIAYGLILPKSVLEIPRLGCINVHASLLPRWRGASPIQQAILHGDSYSGITIMQMDIGMDTGNMLCRVECPVSNFETAGSLHDKLAQISAKPLIDVLEELAHHKAQPIAQNEEQVTYAGKIKKEDALVNWHEEALVIDRKIRAFNPWPIAYTHLNEEVLRLHQAEVVEMKPYPPGTIVNLDKKGMLIATGDKGILITKIQFSGAKAITVADWLNTGKTTLHTGLVLQ